MNNNNEVIKAWREKFPWNATLYRIKFRCENKKSDSYKKYGARGIRCLITKEELKVLWDRDGAVKMEKPSIDRIDPDGHYEFSNCRYLEFKENSGRARAKGRKNIVDGYCRNGHIREKETSTIRYTSRNGNPFVFCRECKVASDARFHKKERKP